MLGRLDYFIIVIVIIILIILVFNNLEHYSKSSITNNKAGLKIENINSGTRTYDDKLFDDVVLYESNPADYSDSGVYKCLQKIGFLMKLFLTSLLYLGRSMLIGLRLMGRNR